MGKFNEIKSRDDLSAFLDIPLKKLTYILYIKKTENYYQSFEIPKKNGKLRHINAPQDDLKEVQKRLANALGKFHKEYVEFKNIHINISHAFEKEKGIITNAIIHRNKRYVLNMDLEDFFDSFHFGRVRGFFEKNQEFNLPLEVATMIAQLTCYKGCLPQGAPSSPIITNLICNILDMKLIKISRKYRLDYTRYADDMTFSTNDSKFIDLKNIFLEEVTKEIKKSGFLVNNSKTRLVFRDSRQEVTGLVVNKKINVSRDYCKNTRAMADSFYKHGEFKINDYDGTIKQLEGRFAFINQLDYYNNKNDYEKKHTLWTLNSREKQYQKFLFYKYFFANSKPLIVTEGKTDICYLKAALKNNYSKYPQLVTKKNNDFEFNISFLRRSKRLEYFLGIQQDGADTMKNIYNFYSGNSNWPNLYRYFCKNSSLKSSFPVILIFDNEQESKRPLSKFTDYAKIQPKPLQSRYKSIIGNLYLLTNPLTKGKIECEIEDLFDETVLSCTIGGKTFSRSKDFDESKFYGKVIFSEYIIKNYTTIDFSEFTPMLDDLSTIIKEFKK
jgi:hypothetical protein